MKQTCFLTKDKPPKEQLKELTKIVSRQSLINFAKEAQIEWKSTENSNIEWMRCSMAIQQNFDKFCDTWNTYIKASYNTEASEELSATTEDKSPEYLYHSGDFQPFELLTHNLESIPNYLKFCGEDVQIAKAATENYDGDYFFRYKSKIVSLSKLELYNFPLIEQYITRKFAKILIPCEFKSGNPIKFWKRNQYTQEQILDQYYCDTLLTYENSKLTFSFTKTKNGWRYLSLHGRLYWFTSEELAYITSELDLIKKQFP